MAYMNPEEPNKEIELDAEKMFSKLQEIHNSVQDLNETLSQYKQHIPKKAVNPVLSFVKAFAGKGTKKELSEGRKG